MAETPLQGNRLSRPAQNIAVGWCVVVGQYRDVRGDRSGPEVGKVPVEFLILVMEVWHSLRPEGHEHDILPVVPVRWVGHWEEIYLWEHLAKGCVEGPQKTPLFSFDA